MASLSETINHLLKTIKNHIGRGGDAAHLPVDNDISGFMTPEMLKRLNSSSGKLPTEVTPDDFYNLSAGVYLAVGTNTNNAPVSSGYHIVQVFDFSDRKVIYCMHAHTGVIYVYSFNRQDGSDLTPLSKRGWRIIPQEVTLWEGKVKNPGANATLIDDVNRYRRLKLFYKVDNSGVSSYIETSVSSLTNGVFSFTTSNVFNGSNSLAIAITVVDVTMKNAPTTFEITRQKTVSYNHAGVAAELTDKIEIFRIIGIK